ncbi:MAG TPA: GMC family oxidoreductase N-terminal domain-containing protein [Phenylobacterium sp.]|nr:GMC family oxidoreductase N-terminal domain-containing protein [Phenylobacterium sp.]
MSEEVAGRFDYVIVGAGSAGCVLAARLTEDPSVRVLLLESGPRNDSLMVNMPAGSFKLMGAPKTDWLYQVEADETRAGRQMMWSAGRMLGGSSAMNGMVYVRGLRRDFDDWADEGCAGWGFDDVLPYFRRSERFQGPPSQARGAHGPMAVSPLRTVHPLAKAFVAACGETGMPPRDDYCDGDQFGSFLIWSTTEKGRRCSAYHAYLKPAMSRPNLRVVTDAEVERLRFDGPRARGVEVRRGGGLEFYEAAGEVIVCGGAIGSPALLLRSGVGPAEELSALGIAAHADLPVGRNLQEHATIAVSKLVDQPSYNSPMGPAVMAAGLIQYLLFKRGPMTSPAVHAMAYARSAPGLADPDICFSFMPLALDLRTRPPKLHEKPGVTIAGQICRPHARGRVRLRGADPGLRPIVEYPMLEDERDLDALMRAAQICEAVFAARPLADHVVGANQPPEALTTPQAWRDYIVERMGMGYHPVGTCRMGARGRSVVDSDLRVHGVAGLRVVDASVMPRITSGNTNAPTIMIAEKAADRIVATRRA